MQMPKTQGWTSAHIKTDCKKSAKKMSTSQLPFPTPVNTNTIGQIPDGSPNVAISSPTAMTAALAAASEGYI
jgi:hypothetical protein